MKNTKITINTIFEFLYGFLLTFQDLPRLHMGSFELRISYLFAPLLFLNLFKIRHGLVPTLKRYSQILIPLGALLLYLAPHLLFICHNTRAMGFTVWLIINIGSLLFVLHKKSTKQEEWISKGFLCALMAGTVHIIIQRFHPLFLVSLDSILSCIDNKNHVRLFSLFGEPSYASLNLIPLFIIASFSRHKIMKLWVPLVLFALSLTYSKVAYVGLGCFFLIKLGLRKKMNLKMVPILCEVILSALIFIGVTEIYPYYFDPAKLIPKSESLMGLSERSKDLLEAANSKKIGEIDLNGMRRRSLVRGTEVFLQHPIFGVGFANSKRYIFENKIRSDLVKFYEGLHNLYLEISVEVGLVGLTFFLWFLWGIHQIWGYSRFMLPFWITTLVSMQFCQNINMPAMWLSLFLSIYYSQKPRQI